MTTDPTPATTPSRKADELLALADRCEREEPSRELDAEILVAFGDQALDRGPRIGWEWRPNGAGIWRRMISPTTSLDAAVTLAPDNTTVKSYSVAGIKEFSTDAEHYIYFNGNQGAPEGRGKTLALALCAASLRALASMEK